MFNWSDSRLAIELINFPLLPFLSPDVQDQHLVSLLQSDFKPNLPVLATLRHVQVPVFRAAFFRLCCGLFFQPLSLCANLLLKLGRGRIQPTLLGKSVLRLTVRLTIALICWQIRICSSVVCFFLRLSIGLSAMPLIRIRLALRCIFIHVLYLALRTLR